MTSPPPSPCPDPTRWKRLAVVTAVAQVLTFGVTFPAFSVLVLPVSAGLGISRPQLVAALTFSTLIGAAVAVPVGRLLDRHGGRILMTLGVLLSVTGIVGWACSTALWQLYGSFTLIGLGIAFSSAEAGTAVLVMATHPRQRDTAILVVSTITGLGTAVYYPATGFLESALGWRGTLLVYAGLLALVAVPSLAWAVPGRAEHARRRSSRRGMSLGPALRSGTFWLLAASFVTQAASNSAFALLMVSYFHDVGHPMTVAASLPIALGVLQVVSRLVLMPLAPRFGMAWLALFAAAVQGVGMLALPAAGLSVPLTLLCMAGIGLGFGLAMVARPSLVASSFGALQFGSILAAMTVMVSVARSGSPLLGSLLGDWRMVVLSGLLSLVAALLLVPVAVRSRRTGEFESAPVATRTPAAA